MTNVLGYTRSITAELPDKIQSLAFAPDGSAVAVGTDTATFMIDVATGESRRLGTPGVTVAWGPCGVVAVGHDRAKRFSVGVSRAKSSGSALLAARSTRDAVEVFGEDGAVLRTLPIENWEVALGGGLLAVFVHGSVRLVDPATGQERMRIDAPHASYVALSPDGSRVLATGSNGSWEGSVTGPLQWYPESGTPAHAGPVFAIGGTVFKTGQLTPVAYTLGDRIAFSPALDLACIAGHQHVQIVALADLAPTPPIVGPSERVKVIVVDDTRGRLAASDDRGITCVWRLDDASLVSAFRTGCSAIAWAPDGTLLAGGHGISVWDTETGRRRSCVPLHDLEDVEHLIVRGDRIFARGRWQIAILDAALNRLATLGPWPRVDRDSIFISRFDVSPDGAIVYVARQDATTLAIPVVGGEPTELAEASTIAATNEFVALSKQGEALLVAGAGEQRPVDHFDAAVAVGELVLCAHDRSVTLHARSGPRFEAQYRDPVRTLAASTTRPCFYSGGSTTWIAERHLDDGRLRRVFASGGGGKVISLAFDPTGDRLAVGEYEGRLHVWSLSGTPRRIGLLDGTTLQPAGTLREPGELGSIEGIAFPGDLVTCGRSASVWSAQDLAAIGTTEPRTFGDYVSKVSRDGTRFLAGGDWGNDAVVSDASGELFRAPGSDGGDRFMDISDDGRLVLIGSVTETSTEMTVYGRQGERIGTLRVDGRVQFAGFSSRGDVLGWTAEKGPFFRWRAASGGGVEKWCDSPVASRSALSSFDRGGGRLALCGETITIVDEQSGARHGVIPPFTRNTTAVAMSDDGRRVAIGSWHGIVRVYDVTAPNPRCIAELCTTEDAGCWAAGPDELTHVRGDAATRLWSEP